MLFTSFSFLFFIILVFGIYWILGRNHHNLQNLVLLLASYIFYGIAEWRMLPLLLLCTAVFYGLGQGISRAKSPKLSDALKVTGVLIGVGVLLYFKYFNFFIESFSNLFNTLGIKTNLHTFNIIMPLGVSYFTFKLISYVIEVGHRKIEPCKDVVAFATFVAFFPTIMSGPIDRPGPFLKQLGQSRQFTYKQGIDGIQQILWGLFKKMVIADTLAVYVSKIWGAYAEVTSSSLVISVILYLIQLYCDFSGYSDMAIGVAKLFGIKVVQNFHYPFFTTNIAEFWRRWHMSLTSWVTDYVFTPLNIKFRNMGNWGLFLAILINMVIIGLWHGANWTYAVFGIYQACLYIPLIVSGRMNKRQKLNIGKLGLPSFTDIVKMVGVFLLFALGTVIIRADNVSQALDIVRHFFTPSILTPSILIPEMDRATFLLTLVFILAILAVEWFQRDKEFGLQFPDSWLEKPWLVGGIDMTLILLICVFGHFGSNTFIYFQF